MRSSGGEDVHDLEPRGDCTMSEASSCLHGLLQETCMVVCGMKQYYLETSENEGEAICALREARTSTIWSHEGIEKCTMSDHGPEMRTVPLETQLLKTFSKMKQSRRILVIDKYNGYGTSTLLKGCEYETLASLEIDSFLKSKTPASLEYVPFLKPWVQECLTSKLRTLLRHEIEGGPILTHSRRCTPPKHLTWCPAT